MKKILSFALALLMLFSLASCGKRKVKIQVPKNKKITILLTSAEQYPEDAAAAQALKERFPDKIVIKQLGDSRVITAGSPEIVTAACEAAADGSIGAIIFDRATQFTGSAISEAKKINPDLLTFAIEPERDYKTIRNDVTAMFVTHWQKYARDIVSAAKQQGAEYFVFFSFPAHVEDGLYFPAKDNIEKFCKEQDIEFIYSESTDPIYSGGIKAARDSVEDGLKALEKEGKIEGENIALFSTDSSVQFELVKLTDKKGLIYIAPSFPTPYNGICDYFNIEMPEDYTDMEAYTALLKDAVKDSKGRFCAFTYPQAGVMLTAAVYTAFDTVISPSLTDDYFTYMDKVVERVLDAAQNKNFEANTIENIFNTVYCYIPSIEIIK